MKSTPRFSLEQNLFLQRMAELIWSLFSIPIRKWKFILPEELIFWDKTLKVILHRRQIEHTLTSLSGTCQFTTRKFYLTCFMKLSKEFAQLLRSSHWYTHLLNFYQISGWSL